MTAAKATAREKETGAAMTAESSAESTVAKRWQLASFSVEIGLGPAAQPLQLPRRGRPSLELPSLRWSSLPPLAQQSHRSWLVQQPLPL